MKINIILGPFGCIPPYALGAVEKLWYQIGKEWMLEGHEVTFISKRPDNEVKETDNNLFVKGYWRTGKGWKDNIILDFVYSFKALCRAPKCDYLILNTIWSPILSPLFRWKFKVSLYNVARFPKRHYGLYFLADSLACVSTAVRKELIRKFPFLERKTVVVPNPIDTDIYSADSPRELNRTPTIVYSGRVHREKGLDILIKAALLVKEKYDISLMIIGPSSIEKGGSGHDYVAELNSMAKDLCIEWVEAIYDAKELANRMSTGDIFCYPSVAENGETFGVAPLEAMGLGLVPVVSSLECFTDFIADGKNGLVFNHRDTNAVELCANQICKLIDNPEYYRQLSMEAIKTSRRFSVKNIAAQYMSVLNKKETNNG